MFMLSQRFDRLQGENPLARQNHHQSTHAYDKHILLKIGKSNSPPGHRKSSSPERNELVKKLSIQTRVPSLLLRPVHEPSSTSDPVAKWMTSPLSAISSTSRSISQDYSMDPRSPSSDIYSQRGTFDTDRAPGIDLQPNRALGRRGQKQSPERTTSRSERGSYDSAIYAADSDYVHDETSLSSLQIEERPRIIHRHGIKRRALSPSPDLVHEHNDEVKPTHSQRFAGAQFVMPSQPYRAGSLSSTASGTQYSSFASSNLASFASSSMTSVSSDNTPVTYGYSHQQFSTQTPRSTHGSAVAILPLRRSPDISNTIMSTQSPLIDARIPPTRIGNHYICSCCPKKPKKFENEEQLRYVTKTMSCSTHRSSNSLQNSREREAIYLRILQQSLQKQERS